MGPTQTITIRPAIANDAAEVERLAQLEGVRPPSGELLVAQVGGELWAAVELGRGTVVADPFRPSGEAAELLRLRSRRLRDGGRRARSRWSLATVRAAAHRL